MKRFEFQNILFSKLPNRMSILSLNLPAPTGTKAKINVWRNHNFESIQALAMPYFSFNSWPVDFVISPYDDSLSFKDNCDADAELIWFDSCRLMVKMNSNEIIKWLEERIRNLRNKTNAPIIIATWFAGSEQSIEFESLTKQLPAVYFANIKNLCDQEKVVLLDPRTSELSGTSLSPQAQLLAARALSCQWLPAAILPPIKGLALDLDNTLHEGILGEDGITGVSLTDSHRELQQYLTDLQKSGIFLSLVSRNEREDVENLFRKRDDYPIKWNYFSVTEISWADKATAIHAIATELRISVDSILFVDDNLGELASVSGKIKNIHTLHADRDASITKRSIMNYPGLWRWKIQDDDTKRIDDLKANSERKSLSEASESIDEYFRNLEVTLIFKNNSSEQLPRLADLCNKTNQFNLALRRFNEAELSEKLTLRNCCITSVQLIDRLSDSGIIAILVAEKIDDSLVIQELCVSCRALGRHLEDTIIFGALQQMPLFVGCKKVKFCLNQGPRNQPAIQWLSTHSGAKEPLTPGQYGLDAREIAVHSKNFDAVKLVKDQNFHE